MYIFGATIELEGGAGYGIFLILEKPALRAGLIINPNKCKSLLWKILPADAAYPHTWDLCPEVGQDTPWGGTLRGLPPVWSWWGTDFILQYLNSQLCGLLWIIFLEDNTVYSLTGILWFLLLWVKVFVFILQFIAQALETTCLLLRLFHLYSDLVYLVYHTSSVKCIISMLSRVLILRLIMPYIYGL